MATLRETRSTAKRKRPQQAAESSPGSEPSADEEINLHCWIREICAEPFGVKMKRSETVDDLKSEMLKEMGDLGRGAAKASLTLWKVSVSIPSMSSPSNLLEVQLLNGHNISETADNCSLDEVGQRLRISNRLSEIFVDEPAEGHIHIIGCTKPTKGKFLVRLACTFSSRSFLLLLSDGPSLPACRHS